MYPQSHDQGGGESAAALDLLALAHLAPLLLTAVTRPLYTAWKSPSRSRAKYTRLILINTVL